MLIHWVENDHIINIIFVNYYIASKILTIFITELRTELWADNWICDIS